MIHSCRLFSWVLLCLTLIPALSAAERTHAITIEDYFTQAFIGDCALSPDGSQVVYVESRWPGPQESASSDLWLVSTTTKAIQRLTFEPCSDNAPRWSPDGQFIYFVSNPKREAEKTSPYDGKRQVWRLHLASSRLEPVTRVAGGIEAYDLSANGRAVYYTTSTEHMIDDWKELRKEFSGLKYGHGVHQVSTLSKLDLVTWRTSVLLDAKRHIDSFDVAPDESRVALISVPDQTLLQREGWSQVDILDVASSQVSPLPDTLWRKEAPSPYGWLLEPSWSGDGKHLAFLVGFDGFPAELLVASWKGGPAEAPQLRRMPRPTDVYLDGGIAWRGMSDEVCYLGDLRATVQVCSARGLNGETPTAHVLSPSEAVVHAFHFAPTAEGDATKMALVQSGRTYSRDLFLQPLTPHANAERLTHVNPQVDTWKLPQISRVTWKGAHGDDVEGILELPPDYQPGTKLPLVVCLHGGPTGADYDCLKVSIYGHGLLPSKGYALLCPNYRGSTGYGDQFLAELIGHENEIEVADIMAGVDALIERGIADPDRLGVMGWSNGGYLTNCLITGTDRFKAASSGAGVFDMSIQWGEEDTPGHVINYLQGQPWKVPAEYQQTSPLYQIKDSFRTATLIHVGEHDERVPVTHSRTLHRALHHYVKVPTELVIYPGTGHGLTQYQHRLAKLKWDHAWFEKYLKPHNP
ncbi:MAG: S9 family peptidase [Planctomycetota bacterium]|nr:MAG: S9 family peptidase [Planctomycetota bacterium]